MKSSDWYAAGRGDGAPTAGAGPGAGALAVAHAARHSAATLASRPDPRARRLIIPISYPTEARTGSHYGRQAEHLVDLDLLFLALDPDAPQRARVHQVAHPLESAVADEDLAGLGIGLKPGLVGHAIADAAVLHPDIVAYPACHRLAGTE